MSFSPPASITGFLRFTEHGFTLYEPDRMHGLLEDAGFTTSHRPGPGRRGDFICAIAMKSA